jgi:hypothetical protein
MEQLISMTNSNQGVAAAVDNRFHRTLLAELERFDPECPPALVYVENGNASWGYEQLAIGYKMAADALIAAHAKDKLGNWKAPIVFMVRQTLELSLKGLFDAIVWRSGHKTPERLMNSHNLEKLWKEACDWLTENGYRVNTDERSKRVAWLLENFHAIDPTGDLFRFAKSRHEAYNKKKSCDRVAAYLEILVPLFDESYTFLSDWTGLLCQEAIQAHYGDAPFLTEIRAALESRQIKQADSSAVET